MATETQGRPVLTGDPAFSPGSIVISDLCNLATRHEDLDWSPFHPGVEIHWIYRGGEGQSAAALIRFQPGARVPLHEHSGYEHIFVLNGSQSDETGEIHAGSLKIHSPGTSHSIYSRDGCLVLAIYESQPRFITAAD